MFYEDKHPLDYFLPTESAGSSNFGSGLITGNHITTVATSFEVVKLRERCVLAGEILNYEYS